jgi:hypothetical protein
MKGTFCRMSVWTRGMPSKKKRAKMPAETPKAAPMGPLCEEEVLVGCYPGLRSGGIFVWRFLVGLWEFLFLHSEESGGSDVAELGLGDGVAVVARILVSVSCA